MSPQRIWKTGGNRTKVVKDNKGNKGRVRDWEGNVVAKQFDFNPEETMQYVKQSLALYSNALLISICLSTIHSLTRAESVLLEMFLQKTRRVLGIVGTLNMYICYIAECLK